MGARNRAGQDRRNQDHRSVGGVRRIGGGLAALAILVAGATRTEAQSQEPQEYVRAKAGAVLRNLQDPQGKELLRPAKDALLLVHDRSRLSDAQGQEVVWLKVSAPEGLPVWVYGKYLDESGVKGVLRVNATAVRMRPLPNSSVASYPINEKLFRGDRVEFIERHDPAAPWAEDWVRVWSPSEARVWVNAAQTTPVTSVAAASTEWQASMRILPSPVAAGTNSAATTGAVAGAASGDAAPPDSVTEPATAPSSQAVTPAPASAQRGVPEEAYRSMAFGNTLLNKALKKGVAAVEADFDPAIRAYRIVLDMAPGGTSVAANASRQLMAAEAHATAAAVREGLVVADERRVREREALIIDLENKALADTAHWGRFVGRGWVESRTVGKQTTWYLRWGGEVRFEVECRNGRYDLALFEGFEVGVKGSTVRQQSMATEDQHALVALLDVTRLEVISAGVRTR